MRFLVLLLFSCFGCGFLSHAQMVQGKVVDDVTGNPLAFVSVVNVAAQEQAYTGIDGRFTLRAAATDELGFSIIGYQNRKLRASQLLDSDDPVVELKRISISLNEVTVRPDWTPYQADSFARARTYKRVLEYKPAGGIMSPVSALAEVFSKKKKRRLRFQKDFYAMEKERFSDMRYDPSLVAQLTHLQGDTLAYFMNLYPMPYDYSRVASDLEISMWIRSNFKDWEEKGRPLLATMGDTLPADSTRGHE